MLLVYYYCSLHEEGNPLNLHVTKPSSDQKPPLSLNSLMILMCLLSRPFLVSSTETCFPHSGFHCPICAPER